MEASPYFLERTLFAEQALRLALATIGVEAARPAPFDPCRMIQHFRLEDVAQAILLGQGPVTVRTGADLFDATAADTSRDTEPVPTVSTIPCPPRADLAAA